MAGERHKNIVVTLEKSKLIFAVPPPQASGGEGQKTLLFKKVFAIPLAHGGGKTQKYSCYTLKK
jgi:hypothetical protein